MIPKIIHYSWFSGDPMPEDYVRMMDTWRKHLPDYEFRLWDADALRKADILFANEAFSARKWAFAADAIRCYAVYHYGGIWLDGDIVLYKSFDPYLNCRMFIGKENSEEFQHDGCGAHINKLTSHCFGAEKGHPFLRDCLDYYENRHFILSENENLPQGLRYDMRLLPSIHAHIAVKYGYKGCITDSQKKEVLNEDIHVYPCFFFDAPKYHPIEDVVCIHNYVHSWAPSRESQSGIMMYEKTRKKGLFYYLYTLVNKILARKGFQIRILSI